MLDYDAVLSLRFDAANGTLFHQSSFHIQKEIPFDLFALNRYFCKRHLTHLSKQIIQHLDQLESIKKIKNTQQLDGRLATSLQTAKKVHALFRQLTAANPSKAPKEIGYLEGRILALEYRIRRFEPSAPLNASNNDNAIVNQLASKAHLWKKDDRQKAFAPGKEEELTPEDHAALREVSSRYPEMAALLLQHSSLRNAFFAWVIQDQNSVETFVEFPGKQQLLATCTLATRIGRMHNSGQCALKLELNEKEGIDLTLPFQECAEGQQNGHPIWRTKRISILDLNQRVKLGGAKEQTLQQIFRVFREKISLELMGDFEWSPVYEQEASGNRTECGGITPWNCWSQRTQGDNPFKLDLSREDWYEGLPGFEMLTEEEIRKRYRFDAELPYADGRLRGELTPGVPFASARISFRPLHKKDSQALSGQQHGSIQVGIPDPTAPADWPRWRVYHFGAFVWDNPGSYANHWWQPFKYIAKSWDYLKFVMNTVPGVISTIDENRYKNFRQKAGYSFVVSPNECYHLMEQLRTDIQSALTQQLPFSYSSLSCAEYAQSTLAKSVQCRLKESATFPDLFKINLRVISSPFPLNWIIDIINATGRLTSEAFKDRLVRFCLKLFALIGCGPGRAMTLKLPNGQIQKVSVDRTDNWRTAQIHMPTVLFQRMDIDTGRFLAQ